MNEKVNNEQPTSETTRNVEIEDFIKNLFSKHNRKISPEIFDESKSIGGIRDGAGMGMFIARPALGSINLSRGSINLSRRSIAVQCEVCNLEVYLIDSISLVQNEGQRILSGKGYINEKYTQNICHNCTRLYEAVTEITSSQLDLILCEKCKSKITKISRTNLEFEFEVQIECENCSKKKLGGKKFLDFLKKLKFELNLGGVLKVKKE